MIHIQPFNISYLGGEELSANEHCLCCKYWYVYFFGWISLKYCVFPCTHIFANENNTCWLLPQVALVLSLDLLLTSLYLKFSTRWKNWRVNAILVSEIFLVLYLSCFSELWSAHWLDLCLLDGFCHSCYAPQLGAGLALAPEAAGSQSCSFLSFL